MGEPWGSVGEGRLPGRGGEGWGRWCGLESTENEDARETKALSQVSEQRTEQLAPPSPASSRGRGGGGHRACRWGAGFWGRPAWPGDT